MGPNKYDKDFRAKLINREITPSADSWNKLDAMLSATQEKKKKPMIWLYVAAGIVGLLFVGNLFMMQLGDSSTDIQVVNQENPAFIEPSEIIQESNKVVEEILQLQPQQEVVRVKQAQNALAKVVAPNNQTAGTLVQQEIAAVDLPIQPTKIKNTISDQDLNGLLASADLRQNPVQKVKVNAKNLLSQVDGEMDLTFREKVIKSAAKNYQNIKIAVSNRNLESY